LRIVLAGAEGSSFGALEKMGAPSVLMSYLYLKRKSDEAVSELLARAKKEKMWIILDSGAHTFLSKYLWLDPRSAEKRIKNKGEEAAKALAEFEASGVTIGSVTEEADQYVKDYIEWLGKFGGYFEQIAELDIGPIVGQERVQEWRDWFLRAGISIMPTIHKHYDKDTNEELPIDFGEFLNGEYEYVGLERNWSLDRYTQFFNGDDTGARLRKYKTKIHGWAMTSFEAIRKLPFFSVASTTWLSGAQFGTTFVYSGMGRIRMHDHTMKDAVRPKFHAFCKAHNIDYDAFLADKAQAVNEFNAAQWVAFAKDEMKRVENAYWLTAKERDAAAQEDRLIDPNSIVIRHDQFGVVKAGEDARLLRNVPRFCNTCYVRDKCPEYKHHGTCSLLSSINIKSGHDLREIVSTMLEVGADRVLQAAMIERLTGGYPDQNIGKELQQYLNMLKTARDIFDDRDEILVKAKGKGIISQIFGGMLGSSGPGHTQKRSSTQTELDKRIEEPEGVFIDSDENGEDQ